MPDGAHMVLMGVGQKQRQQIVPLAFDKGRVRTNDIDAGGRIVPEHDAAIDHDPLAVPLRPEAVKV